VIVISDWWIEEPGRFLTTVAARNSEIWAIQTLTDDEIDPGALGERYSQLIDAEDGGAISITLDAATLQSYGAAFGNRQTSLKRDVESVLGRHLLVRTQGALADFVRTLRLEGYVA
jgi:hypothetical protein